MGGYLSALSDVKSFGDNAVEAYKTMSLFKRIISALANGPHCKRPKDAEELQNHIFCQHLRANQDLAEFSLIMLTALIVTSLLLTCICYFRAKKIAVRVSEKINNQLVNVNTRLNAIDQPANGALEAQSRPPARNRPAIETRVDFEDTF